MTDVRAVQFRCQLKRIRTMADGTVDVTINLPEYCMTQAQRMMEWLLLELDGLLAVPDGDNNIQNGRVEA